MSRERIEAAAARVRPHVTRTPLVRARDDVHLKLESLQPTGSFKVRGFFAAALALPRDRLGDGIVTVSAGNAALAAAYVARTLSVPCLVHMYTTAPPPKIEGVRALGAEPVLQPRDEMLDYIRTRGWEQERGVFIHPFADEELIAGHGSAGLEIVEELAGRLQRVIVPVGGGGFISGVASAVKQLVPDVEVIGVQSDGYPLWREAMQRGGPVELQPSTIADGTTAPFDASMYGRLRTLVDRWVTVPEPRLRVAIGELAAAMKVVAEGAGALAFAALEQLEPGPVTVAFVTGANIDRHLLADSIRA